MKPAGMVFDPQRFVQSVLGSMHDAEPASFMAAGSPEQAARTLAASTPRRRRFRFLIEFVGDVSPTRVVIRRRPPFGSRMPGPHFCGRFVTRGGRTRLEGHFQLDLLSRVLMTVWFGFVALSCLTVIGFTVVALVMALVDGQAIPWRGLLMCVLFIGVGFGMMIIRCHADWPLDVDVEGGSRTDFDPYPADS